MAVTSSAQRVAMVVSDVDGTLLDPDKNLTPGAPQAVQRLKQAGIRFTIVSARPPRLTRQLLSDLQVVEPSGCFNGALLIDPEQRVLQELPMAPGDAQTVADHICKSKLDLWVYSGTDWYVSSPQGPHVQPQEGLMQCKATPLHSRDMSQFSVLKLVGVSDDYDAVKRAEADINSLRGIAISATRSSNYYLDVTHADANKGAVIEALSKMLNIPAEQIATIGDMQTDVLMFRKSGVSIAMGNATDDVKKQATYVTRSNLEDGFAYAMEQFVLGGAQKSLAAD
jgi:Cof subfamily protein (haloacid dehalogenase superfamily)